MLEELIQRSQNLCELCGAAQNLNVYAVTPNNNGTTDQAALLCDTCQQQIEDPSLADANHWRCLNDSMWSQIPAVQVLAFRMLTALKAADWTQSLLEQLYLDEDTLNWANAGVTNGDQAPTPTKDSNGVTLNAGDTVTLIKDLVVKGGGFTAKRGTTVKKIRLTPNPKHVEGRVNGTVIVLVAEYLKKVG
ncbi:MAG: PhnA domain-containing protein [Fuerstiella sp.]